MEIVTLSRSENEWTLQCDDLYIRAKIVQVARYRLVLFCINMWSIAQKLVWRLKRGYLPHTKPL